MTDIDGYEITVWMDYAIGDEAADALFDRIADLVHEDDIGHTFCSMRGSPSAPVGSLVPPTEETP